MRQQLARSTFALISALALLGAGCGDDARDEGAAATVSGGTTPDGGDDPAAVAAFCEAMGTMTTSGDPQDVLAAYDVMEANAPASIADDVDAFLVNAREISTAFAPLGANASAAAIEAAMADLSPEATETLALLTATSQTGQVPPGDTPAIVVLRFGIGTCGLGT